MGLAPHELAMIFGRVARVPQGECKAQNLIDKFRRKDADPLTTQVPGPARDRPMLVPLVITADHPRARLSVDWGVYRVRYAHGPSDPPVIARSLRAGRSSARAAGLLDFSADSV